MASYTPLYAVELLSGDYDIRDQEDAIMARVFASDEAVETAREICKAVNSYATHRALIAELVEALGEAWDIMKHGPAQSGHIEDAESRADAALTRAKEALE